MQLLPVQLSNVWVVRSREVNSQETKMPLSFSCLSRKSENDSGNIYLFAEACYNLKPFALGKFFSLEFDPFANSAVAQCENTLDMSPWAPLPCPKINLPAASRLRARTLLLWPWKITGLGNMILDIQGRDPRHRRSRVGNKNEAVLPEPATSQGTTSQGTTSQGTTSQGTPITKAKISTHLELAEPVSAVAKISDPARADGITSLEAWQLRMPTRKSKKETK